MANTKGPRNWLRLALYGSILAAGMIVANPALIATGVKGVGEEVIEW